MFQIKSQVNTTISDMQKNIYKLQTGQNQVSGGAILQKTDDFLIATVFQRSTS